MPYFTVLILFFFTRSVHAVPDLFRPGDFVPYCGHVYLARGFSLRLGEVEKRLLCGDPSGGQVGQPWKDVPANQARFFLRSFLQARGFHSPDFAIREGFLFARPGPITRLTDFLVLNAPPAWRPPRKRMIVGLPLTPALLDELSSWSESELRNAGFACAESEILADSESGLVRVELNSGERLRILDVLDDRDTGLDPNAIDRYNAFLFDGLYSERLVQLTRRRLLGTGMVQSASFKHDCFPNGVILRRNATVGPSREIRFGFGGNTEEGLRARALGRILHLGRMASTAETRLNASLRRQEARFLFRWYYTFAHPRNFIEPVARWLRLDEPQFASRSLDASLFHGWNQELVNGQLELRLGPLWQVTRLERGQGPKESTLLFANGEVNWLSHDVEFFASSPRTGTRFDLELLDTNRAWGAPFDATRLSLSGLWLLNTFRYDPPLLILGVRYRLGTTLTERNVRADLLPLQLRFFAGGSDDLRGFSRQALPLGGRGALSAATLGLEARMYRVIWRRVDPFIFTDYGRLGESSLRFDPPVYLSPGLGLRWESLIGAFRGFIARSYVHNADAKFADPLKSWRWGLSFVDEF